MRRTRIVALLSASALAGISGISRADTPLFTTQADWGGSTYAPNPGTPQQTGWQGLGYYNNTAGTIVPFTTQDFSNVEYTTYSTDSSTTNGVANFDNAFETSGQVGTSWAGLPSPSGSLTIEDYNAGYDAVQSGEMSPENHANTPFLSALSSGSVLAIDFTSPLGGTTLSAQTTTAPFSGYYLIGMGTYVNGVQSTTNNASATQVFPNKQPANPYNDDVGSFVVNNGSYFTAYLPYSGGLGATPVLSSSTDSLGFFVYVNASSEYGFLNPSSNTSPTAVGNVTIDNIREVSPTWATSGSGSWTASDPVTGSWIGGSLPGGVLGGASVRSATFGDLETGNATATLDQTWTLGTLNFNTLQYQYTIAPGTGGTLVMDNTANTAPAQINDTAGGQASSGYIEFLAVPMQLNSNTVVTVSRATDTLQIGGTASPLVSGTGGLTIAGSGTVLLFGPNTYSGGTVVNAGGNLIAGSDTSLPNNSSLQNNGNATLVGNALLSSLTGTGTLTVGNGSENNIVKLATGSGLATQGGLSISANSALDINNNHLVITYGSGPDPIASIAALLKKGYNGGTWNGTGGITSSAAAVTPGYGLGYADSTDTGNPASLAAGTLEIKYTLLGDTNLDGVVNAVDFGILAANFNKGVTGWDKGDFNYDNVVSAVDFGELAANFNKGATGASVGEPAYDDPAILAFAAANGLLADVPEPASTGMLVLGTLGILGNRRRKKRC